MLRIFQTLRKGEELLFWIQHRIVEIICFSVDVRQRNIICSVVHVQLCFQIFFIHNYIAFLLASG